MKNLLVVCAASFLLVSCSSEAPQKPEANAENILLDMNFLADDLLEGRQAGTRGHDIATRFIANRLEQLGIKYPTVK